MRSSYKETIPNGRRYTMVSTKLLTVALALLCFIGLSTNAQAQCPLVCNNGVNVSLPGPAQGCAVTLTTDMLLEDPGSCPNGVFAITVMNLQGQPIPTGSTIGAEYIGQTLMYSVLDTNSGNSCWGTMDVEDKLAPTITDCGPVTMSCMMNTDPVTDGGDAPIPTINDCSDVNMNVSWFDDLQDIACDDPNMPGISAIITRTWIAADAQGNQSTCEQTITVMRASLDDYAPSCAPNVTVSCTGSGTGNTTPPDTGYPTIVVDGQTMDLVPGSEGMCEIATSFSDETFDLCGGGYKILRTWTVYDFCSATAGNSNNPFTCIQTIEVVDNTAPTITCPPNIIQSTVSSGCNSTIVLPEASTDDNCSSVSVVVMTPDGMLEPGDFLTLDPGDTELIYIATDACGNTTSCPMMFTIIDTTPPTTVCDEHTVVALTTAGEAVVAASVFDDGSTDNCGDVTFEVRRMASVCSGATDFDAFASFSCCDVGETIMVVLRVTDENGNSNQCMIEVEVQDEIGPSISCPPLKIIECGDSYADLSVFGQPTVEDNCNNATVEETVVYNISSCGVGTIVRTFTATDAGGMAASCSQTIKIEDNDPFELADIIWPTDYQTEECGGSLAPADLPTSPVNYREPIVVEDACDLVAVTYTDQVLPVNAPACLKVLRTWIVIDWCQYDPNAPNNGGYWSHVQVLIVADYENPVLTCTGDIVIESLEPDCGSSYVDIPVFTATDCSPTMNYSYEVDFNNDGSTDAFGNTNNASGNFPMGVSKVSVTVEDGCSNQASCDFLISISDAKKPSPICVNGLAVDLMEMNGGGMIELIPEMFDYGSFDNCTAQEDLIIEIFPSVFTCDHVGTQQVTMVVTDEAGNSDFCETYVIIQDNMNICPATSGVMVSGAIQTEMGEGVEQTSVALSATGTSNADDMTAEDGVFMFEDLAENYDYSVAPTNNTNIANGVTTWDIVLITKHILGVELLDSPYKIIAADVNNNGSVTTADLIDLRKSVLLLITEFGNNDSWRFVDADYVFPEPTNPFAETFPEVINENNLTNNAMFSDFVAVKIGDVNGSAQANAGMTNPQSRSSDILQITTKNQELIAGNIYDVTLRASDFAAVQGMQFSIEFHPTALNFHEYTTNGLTNINDNNFGFAQINDGIINVSWDNTNEQFDTKDGLFTISFYAQKTMMLSEVLNISSVSTKAEAYNASGEAMDINLTFASDNTGFALYQNRPNPFKGSTTIGFDLPAQSEASLTIYDMSGKVLKVISGDYHEGYNQIQVSQIELGVTGVLYYQLDTPNNTATRKMVIVK